jgi:hypothetical protein
MLTAGTRRGPYEVNVQIGEWGMGRVKILPPSLTGDPNRLARFQQSVALRRRLGIWG